jgi:hypothetical protein
MHACMYCMCANKSKKESAGMEWVGKGGFRGESRRGKGKREGCINRFRHNHRSSSLAS